MARPLRIEYPGAWYESIVIKNVSTTIFIFFIFGTTAIYASETSNTIVVNMKQCLQTNLNAYQTSHEKQKEYLTAYFVCFPSNFDGFKQLFGYDEKASNESVGPLAEQSHKHILFILPKTAEQVGKERLLKKLVSIGVDGQWQADAVSYLQELLRRYAASDRSLFFTVLGKKHDTEIEAFWRFYFSGPHVREHFRIIDICPGNDQSKACEVLRSMGEKLWDPGWEHLNIKFNLVKAKQMALSHAKSLGYEIDKMKIIADESNTYWNEHYYNSYKLNFPDDTKKLENKKFFAICITPKEIILGGSVWVLIDKSTGEVIEVIRGK